MMLIENIVSWLGISRSEKGVTTVEYAIMLALVAVAVGSVHAGHL